MCYLCKDCIYPTRNVEIEYCGKKNNNLNQTFACQYIYGHSMQDKFWSGGCILIEDFYLSSHRDLNVKVFSCQTDLCNTPQDKIYRIENAVLCENGWYL